LQNKNSQAVRGSTSTQQPQSHNNCTHGKPNLAKHIIARIHLHNFIFALLAFGKNFAGSTQTAVLFVPM